MLISETTVRPCSSADTGVVCSALHSLGLQASRSEPTLALSWQICLPVCRKYGDNPPTLLGTKVHNGIGSPVGKLQSTLHTVLLSGGL